MWTFCVEKKEKGNRLGEFGGKSRHNIERPFGEIREVEEYGSAHV